MNPIGEPDAGNRHVRFDERGWETGDWQSLKHRAHPDRRNLLRRTAGPYIWVIFGHADHLPGAPMRGGSSPVSGPIPRGRIGAALGQQRTLAVHTGSEKLLIQPGNRRIA